MPSTPTMKETDPHSTVVIDPEVVLAARADRTVAAASPDVIIRRPPERDRPPQFHASQAHHPADGPALSVDTTFRATDVHALGAAGGRSSIGTWAVRTVIAVLFAVCSAVAAAAWQTYGDQAQEVIAHWVPRISLTSTTADKTPTTPQPSTQTDDQAAAPSAPASQAADNAPAAPATAASQEQAQLLQSMARDLATMGQQIGELKTSLAQLKAGQDQMAHDMGRISEAKVSERTSEAKPFDPKAIEQTLRPRPAPVAARPPAPTTAAAAPVHRPRPASSYPAYTAPQTMAAPPAAAPMPLQSAPAAQATADDGLTAVRPPTPVR